GGGGEHGLEEGGRRRGQPLAEGLRRHPAAAGPGPVGERFEGRVRVVQPAEHQGLEERGAGHLPPAADEPGRPGQAVGLSGEQRLETAGQLRYSDPHGGLLPVGGCVATPLYGRSSLLTWSLWGRKPLESDAPIRKSPGGARVPVAPPG